MRKRKRKGAGDEPAEAEARPERDNNEVGPVSYDTLEPVERDLGERARLRRVEVPTRPLIVIETLDDLVSPDHVDGAIVKVAPHLRSSERATFDGAAIAAKLRELGAAGVLLAPIVVPDVKPELSVAIAKAESPRAALRTWFAEQPLDDDERKACTDLAESFLDAEGV